MYDVRCLRGWNPQARCFRLPTVVLWTNKCRWTRSARPHLLSNLFAWVKLITSVLPFAYKACQLQVDVTVRRFVCSLRKKTCSKHVGVQDFTTSSGHGEHVGGTECTTRVGEAHKFSAAVGLGGALEHKCSWTRNTRLQAQCFGWRTVLFASSGFFACEVK